MTQANTLTLSNTFTRRAGMALAVGLLAVGSAATALAADLPGKGITVQPIKSSIAEESFQTLLVSRGLQKLGYTVKPAQEIEYATGHLSLANGDATFLATHWDPLHADFYKNAGGDAKLWRNSTYVTNSLQGYLIDKKTADAYHITSLEQLKDPKIAALFGKNGKADLISCDPGWGCGDVVDYQLDKFGLKATVNPVRGKYEALMFENVARLKRGEPVFFYAWAPSWMTNTMVPGKDVVWLPTPFDALPGNVPSTVSALTPGVEGCAGGADPCRMAMAAWNWYAIGNKQFIAANPAVKALVEQMTFPQSTWSYWEKTISQDGSSERNIRKLADDWMSENKATFDGWVATAKAAK